MSSRNVQNRAIGGCSERSRPERQRHPVSRWQFPLKESGWSDDPELAGFQRYWQSRSPQGSGGDRCDNAD